MQRNQTALVLRIDALELKPGDRAFHLGFGSGYCASIIAEVVGPMAVWLGSRWTRGIMTKIVRHHGAYSVEMVSTVVIFSGGQLRDSTSEPLMANALRSGALLKLKSVRRDAHDPADTCVLHAPEACLSMAGLSASASS